MSERDELFVRWELGQTDAADETALAEALHDPEARRAFARNARVAAALGTPDPDSAALTPSITTSARSRTPRIRRSHPTTVPGWAIAAGLAMTIGLTTLLMTMQRRDAPAPDARTTRPVTAAPLPTTPSKPFAYLTTPGRARILRTDGSSHAGWAGEALVPGDTVETTSDLAVLFLVAGAGRLDLDPRSSLSLPTVASDPATTAVRMNLAKGRVQAEVAPRPAGAPFIITSPLATAEVVGTRFSFGIDNDGARLAVDHGTVRLSTATDPGVLVGAGLAGVASDGLASLAPAAADADTPLPTGARVLWRPAPGAEPGWRGLREGDTWRSLPAPTGDPWSNAELRTPVARASWTVATGTWVRFLYHVERFAPGVRLALHLKPEDESNYAQDVIPDAGPGWHQALLRVDGAFHHLVGVRQPLDVGTAIHGAVWGALREEGTPATPARFWIRDVVVYSMP